MAKKKIEGTVEICFSIEIPEETENETKYIVNIVKEKICSLSNNDQKFNIWSDADWSLRG